MDAAGRTVETAAVPESATDSKEAVSFLNFMLFPFLFISDLLTGKKACPGVSSDLTVKSFAVTPEDLIALFKDCPSFNRN